jgi:hypothetical protein
MTENAIAHKIVGAALKVHKALEPDLLKQGIKRVINGKL